MTPDLFACVERANAAEPAGDFAAALEWHQAVPMIVRGRHRAILGRLLREDYEVTSDVPELELVRFGTEPRELSRVMAQLREGRDEVGRASYRILRRALLGTIDAADAAFVAAAVQNPHAYEEVRRRLVRPGQHDVWARWADAVPEPARSRLSAWGCV
jgi:hypothetical protein